MVNMVIISHGEFCEGLLSSLKMIVGDTYGVKAVPLIPGESIEKNCPKYCQDMKIKRVAFLFFQILREEHRFKVPLIYQKNLKLA